MYDIESIIPINELRYLPENPLRSQLYNSHKHVRWSDQVMQVDTWVWLLHARPPNNYIMIDYSRG